MTRAGTAACSTNSLTVEVWVTISWLTAVSTPSRSAPSRTRWIVGARWPTTSASWGRGNTSFTGRPVCRAAIAARTAWGRVVPFDPKPPPTCSETTVIRSGSRPSARARLSRTLAEPWLESWTVRCPSAHTAVAACGSMGWLCSATVRYVASTWTLAPARARSTSPRTRTAGWPPLASSGV